VAQAYFDGALNRRQGVSVEQNFDALISALYEAASDPINWPAALSALAQFAEASSAQVSLWDDRDDTRTFAGVRGEHHMPSLDAQHGAVKSHGDQSSHKPIAKRSRASIDTAIAEKDELVTEGVVPPGGRFFAATVIRVGPGIDALVGLHRTTEQGRFKPNDLARLERVIPHLARALKMNRSLAMVSVQDSVLRATLNKMPESMAIVDEHGAVLFMNAAAEEIFKAGDGLRILNGRITAERPADARELLSQITQTCQAAAAAQSALRAFLSISRGSLKRPFGVVVRSLGGFSGRVFNHAGLAALLLISDMDSRAVPQLKAVRQMFGLSDAEARVAVSLAAGKSAEEIAGETQRSKNTVRVQTQAILEKTGTSRQAELVGLLLSMPAMSWFAG
jgi:DNA-binding CsgD family transcriptional regulator/PAS domain-containing protein